MPFAALGAPRFAPLARDRLASPLSSSRAAPAPPARAMAPRARADGSAPPKTVLVAGAGIIGTSIAYHLAVNHGIGATLVDKVGPHCAASGKAGGFLALDWCDGSPLGPLARASFAMHDALAETLALDSYRRLTCEAVALDPRRAEGAIPPREPLSKKLLSRVEWADASSVSGSRPMGDERTIAQVHPAQLCDAMLRRAEAVAGAKVIVGDVSALSRDPATGACVGLVVDGEVIRADAVVVAMGPWTSRVLSAAEIPGAPAVPAVSPPAAYAPTYQPSPQVYAPHGHAGYHMQHQQVWGGEYGPQYVENYPAAQYPSGYYPYVQGTPAPAALAPRGTWAMPHQMGVMYDSGGSTHLTGCIVV